MEDVTKCSKSLKFQAERFAIEDDRVLYMFREGSQAWEAKDYVIEQEQCEEVMLEQQTYLGTDFSG